MESAAVEVTNIPIRSGSSQPSLNRQSLLIESEEQEAEGEERYTEHHNRKKINMDEQILKVNLLAITLAGALIALGGIGLYFARFLISSRVRYFLPIPPIGVAAYVFVFNLFKFYNASLPSFSYILIEVLVSTLTAASVFFFLVVSMISIIWVILHYVSP